MKDSFLARCALAAYQNEPCPDGIVIDKWFSDEKTDAQAYVAIVPNERSLVIAFRGTSSWKDALIDVNAEWIDCGNGIKQHSGFYSQCVSIGGKICSDIQPLLSGMDTIYIVGHSLGGALAQMFAFNFNNNLDRRLNLVVRAFEAPRWGNGGVKRKYEAMALDAMRYNNWGDPVPHMPTIFMGYIHAGNEVKIGCWYPFEGILDFIQKKYSDDASTIINHDCRLTIANLEKRGL